MLLCTQVHALRTRSRNRGALLIPILTYVPDVINTMGHFLRLCPFHSLCEQAFASPGSNHRQLATCTTAKNADYHGMLYSIRSRVEELDATISTVDHPILVLLCCTLGRFLRHPAPAQRKPQRMEDARTNRAITTPERRLRTADLLQR